MQSSEERNEANPAPNASPGALKQEPRGVNFYETINAAGPLFDEAGGVGVSVAR